MLTFLLVEHFTLTGQPVTLCHQTINLLSPLKHTFDRLMQYNLSFVQLLLNLHDAIRLLRILIFCDILFELWEGQGGI